MKYYVLDTSALTYALEDYGYSVIAGANDVIRQEIRQWKSQRKELMARYTPKPRRMRYVHSFDEAIEYAKGKTRVGTILERRHVAEVVSRLILTQCLQGIAKCIVPRSIDKEIQETPYGILYDEISEYIKLRNHHILNVVEDPRMPHEVVEMFKQEGLSEQDIRLLYLAEALKKKGYDVVLVTGDRKLHEIASKKGIRAIWLFSGQLQDMATKLKAIASRIFKVRKNEEKGILV